MTNDLSVDFVGRKLENPFVLASAPPTASYDKIRIAFDKGWAGAITKSVSLFPLKDKSPRMKDYKNTEGIFAYQNYEMGSDKNLDYWVEGAKKIKGEFPNKLLIVSLFGTPDLNEWVELTRAFRGSGIDGFELNYSCPHSDSQGKGYLVGQNVSLCKDITQVVKENSDEGVIIMPKLPYLSYPNECLIAKSCAEVGANSVAAINTIAGLTSIDSNTLKPKLNTQGKTSAGGFSYKIIQPFAYLIIANLSSSGLPVSAGGGVTSDKEVLASFFSYGANHLQVCSEVMNKKVGVIKELKNNLIELLDQHEMTLNQFRGNALDKVVSWNEL